LLPRDLGEGPAEGRGGRRGEAGGEGGGKGVGGEEGGGIDRGGTHQDAGYYPNWSQSPERLDEAHKTIQTHKILTNY